MNKVPQNSKNEEFLSRLGKLGEKETMEVIVRLKVGTTAEQIRTTLNGTGAYLKTLPDHGLCTIVGSKEGLTHLISAEWVVSISPNQPVFPISPIE